MAKNDLGSTFSILYRGSKIKLRLFFKGKISRVFKLADPCGLGNKSFGCQVVGLMGGAEFEKTIPPAIVGLACSIAG